MVLPEIPLDPIDDGCHPLDNQTLEPVSLVQISVHELLHRLPGELGLLTLLVILDLLLINVVDDIFQLLERELTSVGLPDRP